MKRQMLAALLSLSTFHGVFSPVAADQQVKLTGKDTDVVVFNVKSSKYHIRSCHAAKQCTHCIEISRKDAKSRGGVACKLCGAGEL